MHSVIRKRQGLPWQPEEPKGMSANLSHLVGVQVQAGPFPTDELGLAYSQRSHPKLVRQVVAEDDDLRRKSDEYERELAQPENELPAWRMRGEAEREVPHARVKTAWHDGGGAQAPLAVV